MALLNLNLSDPLMKALKAVNSIAGKSLTEEDLRRQRSAMELAGRLAAPTGGVSLEDFSVGPTTNGKEIETRHAVRTGWLQGQERRTN